MRPWIAFVLKHITFNKNGAVSEPGFIRLAQRMWPEENVWEDVAGVLSLSKADVE